LNDFKQLESHNFCWYKDGLEIKISLKIKSGATITIILNEETKNDVNYNWLINHKLTHITTASYEVGIDEPNPSIDLNRQVLCP